MEDFARTLIPMDIEEEMRSSYLDYSMSVIVGRALPDVRDGLKPVHRRILYAMFREGNLSSKRYIKCAGVVGEVLKKYHPHGDSAVYDALVRMAQPWNMRYLLVDGQGNFGSVDGDPAAAYRYTESRMTRLAEELLADIDKDTVNFGPTFDGSHEEPLVLPAAFPNLLVNGSDGIAVGMATKIPPHNLGEIIDAVVALIDNPNLTFAELYKLVPGPDFPTAGTIHGTRGIREAYETGRGRLDVRARTEFEELDNGRVAIIVDELPFQVNKARLQEDIADHVKEKRIEGIHAIRDESDRQGMRLVIELKRDATPEVVLNQLFKHTDLQTTFGVILLSIVQGRPMVLTLREMLEYYLAHRRDVTLRRCRYELEKALARQHILEGYLKALDHLDQVIALIRGSQTPEDARNGLVSTFGFSEIQAQAILDLRLQRLTGMERIKIEDEYREIAVQIAELKEILNSEARLLEVIRGELLVVREKYADPRRTRIIEATADLRLHDLIAEEEQVITLTVNGYIKRSSMAEFREQRRGGLGMRGMRTRGEDSVREIFIGNTHSRLMVFTTQGQVFGVPVHQIPETGRDATGTAIINLVPFAPEDNLASIVSVKGLAEDRDLLFCSRHGLVKRTRLDEFENLRSSGLRAYDCADGDELYTVVLARTEQHVFIATKDGTSIRFPGKNEDGELEVRHTGRVARGVRGITLQDGDEIAGMLVLDDDPALEILTITENGYGKRTPLEEYRVQGRGGKGVINIVVDERNGRVVGSLQVHESDSVMLITNTGRLIRIRVADIRKTTSRAAKGVTLMRVEQGERVVSVTRVVEGEAEEEGVVEATPPVDEEPVGDEGSGGEPGGEPGGEA